MSFSEEDLTPVPNLDDRIASLRKEIRSLREEIRAIKQSIKNIQVNESNATNSLSGNSTVLMLSKSNVSA